MPLHKGHIFLDYTFSTSSVSPVERSEEKTGRQRCQADPDANFEQAGWAVCLQMNPRFLSPIDTQRERLPLQKTAPVDFLQKPRVSSRTSPGSTPPALSETRPADSPAPIRAYSKEELWKKTAALNSRPLPAVRTPCWPSSVSLPGGWAPPAPLRALGLSSLHKCELSGAADSRYIHCGRAASRWQLCNRQLLLPSPGPSPSIPPPRPPSLRARTHTHTRTHACMHAHTCTRALALTPLVNPGLWFPAKLSHTSILWGNPSLPSFAESNEATRSRPQVEGGDASAEAAPGKKPQRFAKSSNIYLGFRDIFNNPINNKNSFECLLALGKTLFPRQIALNF